MSNTNASEKRQALDFLAKDFLTFAPMIEALDKNDAALISVHDFGVAMKHKEGIVLIGVADDDATLHFKDRICDGGLNVVYGNTDPDYIINNIPNIIRAVPCHQVVYTKKSPPKLKMNIEYRLMDAGFIDFFYDNYSRSWDKAHMRILLEREFIFGAYVGGEIIGFIGRHMDGSMGFLEILPKFRRQGYGKELENFIIGRVMSEGRIPFAHIVMGNEVSMSLQGKVEGLDFAKKLATWVRVKT